MSCYGNPTTINYMSSSYQIGMYSVIILLFLQINESPVETIGPQRFGELVEPADI